MGDSGTAEIEELLRLLFKKNRLIGKKLNLLKILFKINMLIIRYL